MRRAKLDDIQRRLRERSPQSHPRLTRLRVEGLSGFEDFEITPGTGFVTFCGGTGSGKSSLLDICDVAAGYQWSGERRSHSARLEGVSADIELSSSEGAFSATGRLDQVAGADKEGYDSVLLVGLAERTYGMQSRVLFYDISSLKEGVTPYELEQELVDFLSYVCRRNYSKVTIWELENEDGDVLPYFELHESSGHYGSEGMGSGELSAFYIAWALRYVSARSVILIDEPEAFLPPSSHEAVYYFIAHIAVVKRLCVIITTHSPALAAIVPPNSLFAIRRVGDVSKMEGSNSAAKTLTRLGLKPTATCILYAEDALVRDVVLEVIAKFDLQTVCNFDVTIRPGGKDVLKRAVENASHDLKYVKIAGVLDGDVKAEAAGWDCIDRLAFLPFRTAPEQEMLSLATTNLKSLARLLDRDAAAVQDALADSVGADHHERLRLLAERLGYSTADLTRRAWQLWLKKGGASGGRALARRIAVLAGVEVP